jgi:Replication-relaxation
MPTRRTNSRFKRPPAPPAITLTEDDVSILWHVFRHRLIDSRSLYSLFPNRSDQVISRRLNRLWKNEFLDRPVAQNIKSTLTPGSDYLVYALAREGARFLRTQHGIETAPERWSHKNAKLRPQSIQHHLSTTRLLVRLAVDIHAHVNAQLTYGDTLLAGAPVSKRRRSGLSNTLRTAVDWYGQSSIQGTAPDQVFGITINGEKQFIFLEIDEGTETVEPNAQKLRSERFWRETSFLRKMAIYSAAFRSGAHKKQFLLPSFRVLTVTTSPERVETMQTAYRSHLTEGERKVPPGLFLFTDWQALKAFEGSLLSLPLQNAAGRVVRFDPDDLVTHV